MAVSVSRSDRQIAFVLEKSAPFISNEIKRNDSILAIFGLKNRFKIQNGGDLFEHEIEKSENSNVGWRGRFAQIDTNQQDSWRTLKYSQATLDGSIIVNLIEMAQAASEWKKHDLMKQNITNTIHTISRKLADALRAAAPGANEPESLLTIIQKAAFGTQTGTMGGLNRADYATIWQNQYHNTASDLSAQAGLKQLMNFYWQSVSKGAAVMDQSDFGLLSGTQYAGLSAFSDNARRWSNNEEYSKLGFNNIKVLNMTLVADPAIDITDLYMLNTNHLYIQILKMDGLPQIGGGNGEMDDQQNIPISWGPLQLDIDSPNYVKMFFVTMNLTCNSLQRQGVMDNLS